MRTTLCPKCGAEVVDTMNGVLLDPAVEYDEVRAPWTLMVVGRDGGALASVGNPSPDGRGHPLHEHQREEA